MPQAARKASLTLTVEAAGVETAAADIARCLRAGIARAAVRALFNVQQEWAARRLARIISGMEGKGAEPERQRACDRRMSQ